MRRASRGAQLIAMNPVLQTRRLQRALTLRYCVGLALVAIILISGYAFLAQRLKANASDAYIINIAGMQRMLSQRIALSATRLCSMLFTLPKAKPP